MAPGREKETGSKIEAGRSPVARGTGSSMLAGRCHFSGGQIDNIARKREIREILYGNKTDLIEVIDFCEEEPIARERSKTGYTNKPWSESDELMKNPHTWRGNNHKASKEK